MAERVHVVCPKCKVVYRVPEGMAPGAQVRCRRCGGLLTVPHPPADGSAAAPGGGASLAGSDDDPQVSLGEQGGRAMPQRPGQGDPEPPAPEEPSEESVESFLRSCGSRCGRYVQQGWIGRGGMGEIALCVDRSIRRQVAVKRMLPSALAHPRQRARFIEEAQVTGQLEHPNIVPVHELDADEDGTPYFTMKLIKGRSLAEILQAARDGTEAPSLSDLLGVFLKVCDGVAFAHSRGVVHRDLKPANIMVGDFGEVLVVDWGVAKVLGREDLSAEDAVVTSRADSGGEHAHTMAGAALGTPAYMPPEQAEGKLALIDARSDIYSLGAILYEMLTLERPVEGTRSREILANVIAGRIIPPDRRAPDRRIPRELSAVVMECLQTRPVNRYQTVGELQQDVRMFLEGRSVSAAPDSFSQAFVKLVKRNKAVSAAIGAAAVLLLAVGVFSYVRIARERDRAVASDSRATENEKKAVAARDGQRKAALDASQVLAYQAIRAAEEGRFTEADARAEATRTFMPDSPWGHYALAMIARQRQDTKTARGLLEKALSFDASHDQSRAALSQLLAQAGDVPKASALVSRLDQVTDWRSLASAGETLMAAGKYQGAVKAYQRAVALMEKDATVHPSALAEMKYQCGWARAERACVGFYEAIRKLPVEEQQRRLSAKFAEVHGKPFDLGFTVQSGVMTGFSNNRSPVVWLQPLRGMSLTSLICVHREFRDLGPLKGMPLTRLDCYESGVTDLGPLKGMPLTSLECSRTRVSDLGPLKGAPLTSLYCDMTQVRDLGPLEGMPMKMLGCGSTRVSDLGPLKGMPLTSLRFNYTRVSDLGPLKGMPLTSLDCNATGISNLSPLEGMPLTSLDVHYTSVNDLGPLKGMALTSLECGGTRVNDLSLLNGMPLTNFDCGDTLVTDLGPLKGMHLTKLGCCDTKVSDLGPLKGMPLKSLACYGTRVSDLGPLEGMRLESLRFTPKNIKKGIELVRGMKTISEIGDHWTRLMSPDAFWKKYDAGEFNK